MLKEYYSTSWDLTDLLDDKKNTLKKFISVLNSDVKKVGKTSNFLNDQISEQRFLKILKQLENISERLNIITSFAHLKYSSNTLSNVNSALVTEMDLLGTRISNDLIFFDIWFKNILNERTATKLINSVNPVYRQFLKHKRLLGKYTLSEKEEKIINIFEVTGPNALVKIYDRMTSDFDFVAEIRKRKKILRRKFDNKEKLISLVRSEKPEERTAAYEALLAVYKKNSGILGEIFLNLIIQWHDENIKIRHFKTPISVRNTYNAISDDVVDTLLNVCQKNSYIFQKYFKLKARMLKVKKLERYHLYSPVTLNQTKQRKYSYDQSINIVLSVFESFDPIFKEYAQKILSQNHVDSKIRKGKIGGAFCSSITPKISPFVLLNFDGTSRDISTIAHEFGHAIHSMCSSKLPISVFNASLPLAETASVFCEMLLDEKLIADTSECEHAVLLAQQIDDMYATILRQSYFTLFEIDAHNKVIQNNATIDELSILYYDNLVRQFGDSVTLSEDFQWEWLYIPHFYHTPFYCYAYSFGNLLVLSLFNQYKKEGKLFIPKYLKLLTAGGSQKIEHLLNEIGIDISKSRFWQQGFDLVSEKITELEKLI